MVELDSLQQSQGYTTNNTDVCIQSHVLPRVCKLFRVLQDALHKQNNFNSDTRKCSSGS